MNYCIRHDDFDHDLVYETHLPEEDLFVFFRDAALEWINDLKEEDDFEGNDLIEDIKTGDWIRLLESLNKFLWEMGNGEQYIVTPIKDEVKNDSNRPV